MLHKSCGFTSVCHVSELTQAWAPTGFSTNLLVSHLSVTSSNSSTHGRPEDSIINGSYRSIKATEYVDSSGNIVYTYSGDVQFESLPEHRCLERDLSWFFSVHPSKSRDGT